MTRRPHRQGDEDPHARSMRRGNHARVRAAQVGVSSLPPNPSRLPAYPRVMPRSSLSDAERHARAVQAARRMISGGERPGYRLEALPDGSWAVVGLPVVTVAAVSRRDAPEAARRRSPQSSRCRRTASTSRCDRYERVGSHPHLPVGPSRPSIALARTNSSRRASIHADNASRDRPSGAFVNCSAQAISSAWI